MKEKEPCNHQFDNIDNYDRDDLGFYLTCIHCNESIMFDVDTVNDFYALFDLGDDDY